MLLCGGREERLTSQAAADLGGEPLLLQRCLTQKFQLEPRRIAIYSAAKVTNHNLWAMQHYARQVLEFTGNQVELLLVEEGFLIRRVAAALHTRLQEERVGGVCFRAVRFVAVGARTFRELVALHNDREDIALALVVGEYTRLQAYRVPSAADANQQDGRLLKVDALADMPEPLVARLTALVERHAHGLLGSGRALLEHTPRPLMLKAATPRPRGPLDAKAELSAAATAAGAVASAAAADAAAAAAAADAAAASAAVAAAAANAACAAASTAASATGAVCAAHAAGGPSAVITPGGNGSGQPASQKSQVPATSAAAAIHSAAVSLEEFAVAMQKAYDAAAGLVRTVAPQPEAAQLPGAAQPGSLAPAGIGSQPT